MTFKHSREAKRSLEMHVYPKLGHLSLEAIKIKDVKSVLLSLQNEGKLETAHRVYQRIRSVFQFAVMNDLTE